MNEIWILISIFSGWILVSYMLEEGFEVERRVAVFWPLLAIPFILAKIARLIVRPRKKKTRSDPMSLDKEQIDQFIEDQFRGSNELIRK